MLIRASVYTFVLCCLIDRWCRCVSAVAVTSACFCCELRSVCLWCFPEFGNLLCSRFILVRSRAFGSLRSVGLAHDFSMCVPEFVWHAVGCVCRLATCAFGSLRSLVPHRFLEFCVFVSLLVVPGGARCGSSWAQFLSLWGVRARSCSSSRRRRAGSGCALRCRVLVLCFVVGPA